MGRHVPVEKLSNKGRHAASNIISTPPKLRAYHARVPMFKSTYIETVRIGCIAPALTFNPYHGLTTTALRTHSIIPLLLSSPTVSTARYVITRLDRVKGRQVSEHSPSLHGDDECKPLRLGTFPIAKLRHPRSDHIKVTESCATQASETSFLVSNSIARWSSRFCDASHPLLPHGWLRTCFRRWNNLASSLQAKSRRKLLE